MHAAYSHIDSVLDDSLVALDSHKVTSDIVIDSHIVES